MTRVARLVLVAVIGAALCGCSKPTVESTVADLNKTLATGDGKNLDAYFTREALESSVADYLAEVVDKQLMEAFARRLQASPQGMAAVVPEAVRVGVLKDMAAKINGDAESPFKGRQFKLGSKVSNGDGDPVIADCTLEGCDGPEFLLTFSRVDGTHWKVVKVSRELWLDALPPDKVAAVMPSLDEVAAKYHDQLAAPLRETPQQALEAGATPAGQTVPSMSPGPVQASTEDSNARDRVLTAVRMIEEYAAASDGVYPKAGSGTFSTMWRNKRPDDLDVSPWGGKTGGKFGVDEVAAPIEGKGKDEASSVPVNMIPGVAVSGRAGDLAYGTVSGGWASIIESSTGRPVPVRNYFVAIYDRNGNPFWAVRGGK